MGCHLGRAWDGGSGNPLHFTTASRLEWGEEDKGCSLCDCVWFRSRGAYPGEMSQDRLILAVEAPTAFLQNFCRWEEGMSVVSMCSYSVSLVSEGPPNACIG